MANNAFRSFRHPVLALAILSAKTYENNRIKKTTLTGWLEILIAKTKNYCLGGAG